MTRRASLLLALQLPVAVASGQALPWKIDMRQVREPTPNGDCGPIELNVRDATGKTPLTPDGKQVDWQDFDITLTQGEGPLKLISNGRFLCATAPGATGVITAKYPESTYLTGNGKGRTGKKLIPGVTATGMLEVRSAGTAPVRIATSPTPSRAASMADVPSVVAPIRSVATGGTATPADSATAVTAAHARDASGQWQPVGSADWTCLNMPSALRPSTQAMTIAGTSRVWRNSAVVPSVAVDAFAGTNTARLLSGAPGANVSSVQGTYSLRIEALSSPITRIGFVGRATGYLDTYEIGNYFDPSAGVHAHDISVVHGGTADTIAIQAGVSRRAADGLVLGSIFDCQGRNVSNATAVVSRAAVTNEPLAGITTAYFDPSGRVIAAGGSSANGEFVVFNVPVQFATAYLQVWGYTSEASVAQSRKDLLALTVLPVTPGSATIAALRPRTDADGTADVVPPDAGAASPATPGSPTFVVALPATNAPMVIGRNPGFVNPGATTRANVFTGTEWSEAGPADWSCLMTPSADVPSTHDNQLAGIVRSWTSSGVAPVVTGTATVAAFRDRPAPSPAALASASPAYAMTLPASQPSTTRIATGAKAPDHLDTYRLGIYLQPNLAQQSLDVPIVGRAAADALALATMLARDPMRTLVIGSLHDCADRPVSNAIVTVSAAPETPSHADGATSAYFTATGSAAPLMALRATSASGRFLVMNVPGSTGDAYVQAWGFASPEDLAAGHLRLLGVSPTPIPIGSALIVDVEPRRD